MDKLSRQDVFNLAHDYYAKGGATGFNGDSCIYFGDDGGRCAIGVVLDHLGFSRSDLNNERDYNEEADAREIISVLGERFTNHLKPDVFAEVEDADWGKQTFLLRIQAIHDKAAQYGDSDDVTEKLVHFAKVEGLTVPQ